MPPSSIDARYPLLRQDERPIPGFRLIRCRGRGGFGEVWEAEAPGGFLVALKFVRLSSRGRAAELRALEFVRGIHHPNLLANFGSWQVDDTLIIGMELADRSLWDRYVEAIRQGYRGIPRAELLGYLSEVASGIDHLNDYRHSFDGRTSIGVQHRDLKPPNILLFGGGAKVADLGMARAMEGEVAGHTGIWTFSYAAPEFFRGQTTRQSDQYGLAATFCQLRGGRLPFGGDAASVTAGHLFARPDLEALPPPERPIVERALAKVPGERWPSCRAFVDALRALPADSVADALLDPDGPSSLAGEPRPSGHPGFCFPPGWVTSSSQAMESGWQHDMMSSGSTSVLPFAAVTPEPEGFVPPGGFGPSAPPASSPTLIFPDTVITPRAMPETSRGPAWNRRLAVAAAAVVALPTVLIPAPNRDHESQAARAPRDRVPARVLVPDRPAEPVPAPSVEVPPRPASPVEVVGINSDGDLETEPILFPLAGPEPGPVPAHAEAGSRPPADAPPVVAAGRPGQGPAEAGRPDPILEAPIGPGVTSLPALPPLTERRASDLAGQAGPPALAPKPGESEKVAGPPVPARSLPDPDARTVALNVPAPDAARGTGPAPTLPRGRADAAAAGAAFARGWGLFQQNSFDRAAVEFDEAIRLSPKHVASHLLRAIARHRAGDPRAALADYAEVIRARPDDVTAYISRGQAYQELKDYDRAIADYDEAIRRRPGDGDVRFRRGLARFRLADYAGSVVDFTEALRLDRDNAYAAEFRAEAVARRDAKDAKPPGPAAAPAAGVAPGSPAVRETTHLGPPTPTAPPAAGNGAGGVPGNATSRPRPNPNPAERRRPPGRRLLPWPWPRSK